MNVPRGVFLVKYGRLARVGGLRELSGKVVSCVGDDFWKFYRSTGISLPRSTEIIREPGNTGQVSKTRVEEPLISLPARSRLKARSSDVTLL